MFSARKLQFQRFVFFSKKLELIAELSVIIDKLRVGTLLFVQLSAELNNISLELVGESDRVLQLTVQTHNLFFEHLLFSQELISLRKLTGLLDRFLIEFIDLSKKLIVLSSESIDLTFEISDSDFIRLKTLNCEEEFVDLTLEIFDFSVTSTKFKVESVDFFLLHARLSDLNLAGVNF